MCTGPPDTNVVVADIVRVSTESSLTLPVAEPTCDGPGVCDDSSFTEAFRLQRSLEVVGIAQCRYRCRRGRLRTPRGRSPSLCVTAAGRRGDACGVDHGTRNDPQIRAAAPACYWTRGMKGTHTLQGTAGGRLEMHGDTNTPSDTGTHAIDTAVPHETCSAAAGRRRAPG